MLNNISQQILYISLPQVWFCQLNLFTPGDIVCTQVYVFNYSNAISHKLDIHSLQSALIWCQTLIFPNGYFQNITLWIVTRSGCPISNQPFNSICHNNLAFSMLQSETAGVANRKTSEYPISFVTTDLLCSQLQLESPY